MSRWIPTVVVLCVIVCFAAACFRKAKPAPSQQPSGSRQETSATVTAAYKNKITFTVAEAAELLKVETSAVLDAITAGKLKAAKIGNDYRISRPDLETFWLAQGGGKLFQ
jgi:excisionase family DNA binding protein